MVSLTNKTVITRKEHRCFACRRKFPANTKMNYWSGVYEGDFNSGYSCLTCVDIMNAHGNDGEGFPEGYVINNLERGQTPEEYLNEMKSNTTHNG